MNPYLYIFGTILFTVYGQIVLKWRLTQLKFELPDSNVDKMLRQLAKDVAEYAQKKFPGNKDLDPPPPTTLYIPGWSGMAWGPVGSILLWVLSHIPGWSGMA
jgi:hypothetical protein